MIDQRPAGAGSPHRANVVAFPARSSKAANPFDVDGAGVSSSPPRWGRPMNAPIGNNTSNVVPFRRRPRRERVITFRIRASSLKEAVVNAYLDHLISVDDVAACFAEYDLAND